jgi:glycosidase
MKDPPSVLNWYRQLIKLRRGNSAFYNGDYVVLNESDPNVMSYLRKSRSGVAVVVLNFSDQPQTVTLDAAKVGGSAGHALAATNSQLKNVDFSHIALEPYGVLIAEVQKQ